MAVSRDLVETVAQKLGKRGPHSTLKGTTAGTTGKPGRDPSVAAPAGDELELRATLGEGGMGIVELATQRSLARDVAVKRVRDPDSPAAVAALVAEATVTGGLEHPAIVPVHALLRDARGPLMVMKRVQGVTLGTLIHEPDHPRWAELGSDRLGVFIQIVRRLSDALALAASRDIVHRDVKPDNVMVGAYGEVYLLDWGIAAPASTRLDAEDVAGTPAYMAPEMLEPDSGRIDARSDVYLLGATLHECITGKPPHVGDTMFAVLLAASESKPVDYGPEVPAALATLLRKAMHWDRDERYSDARELGRALDAFVAHRASMTLVEAADERRAALEKAIADGAPSRDIHAMFQACHFAYEHALRDWPASPAREGRERALLLVIEHALATRDVGTARGLLGSLTSIPERLRERLETLEAELARAERERERLRTVEREHDIAVGETARRTLVRTVAITMTVVFAVLVVAYAADLFVPTPRSATFVSSGVVGLLSVLTWRSRALLFRNRVSRQIAYSVMMAAALVVAHRTVGVLRDASIAEVASGDAFILASATGLSALTLRRLLLIPAALFFAVALLAPFLGDAAFAPVLLAGLATILLLLVSPRALAEPVLGAAVSPTEPKPPD